MWESGRRDAETEVPFLFHQAALQDAGLHLILCCRDQRVDAINACSSSIRNECGLYCMLLKHKGILYGFIFDSSPAF